jgi:acyl-CoA reductase-like NAD-dependent aldehyde dehydrogenase
MPAAIETSSPLDNRSAMSYPTAGPGEVTAAMEKARMAFDRWRTVPVSERCAALGRLRRTIARQAERIVRVIVDATGKIPQEALSSDVYPSLEILRYYEKSAERFLRSYRVPTPLVFGAASSHVSYEPRGAVLVIAPWNYPLFLALAPIVTAVAAGNAVVLKPSEVTPSVGELIGSLCAEAEFPDDLVQVVYGGGETGRLLVGARPDMIFFTGGVATGRKVMAQAAESLTPLILELGAKDPMIVFDDADFERSVNGALYGAFSNSGQICVSVERLYVQRGIYDRFLEALRDGAGRLRLGAGNDHDLGPLTFPPQAAVIDDHIDDALRQGAVLLTPRLKKGNFYYPVILTNVHHGMRIMREETFGPVLPVMPFDTEPEAIALANDSVYGLSASVWTKDRAKGKRVAARLAAGNCAINDVVKNIGNPHLPFGGVKFSGFGRYHGPEGLHAFSVQKSVMVNRSRSSREINWFPYSAAVYESLLHYLQATFAGEGILAQLRAFRKAFRAMRRKP